MKSTVGNEDEANNARDRLLEAATRLFIANGYRSVTLRQIAVAAKANSALISYYFGDKEGLFKAVYKTVSDPINEARMERFDSLERSGKICVESLMEAWIAPMFPHKALATESPIAVLSLSLNAEQSELTEQLIIEVYDELNDRFLTLLGQCVPHLSRSTMVWRLYFLVGAVLTATLPRNKSVKKLSRGPVNYRDVGELIAQLVAFASAGFRAPEVS